MIFLSPPPPFSRNGCAYLCPVMNRSLLKDPGIVPLWQYFLLVFGILALNKLGFDASGGEEHYLSFARQYVDPDWIPGSFTLTEFAGTRIVFQWIMGFFMSHFSFEAVVFGSRLVNFLLIGLPVAMLFKELKFTLPLTFVVLQFFVMSEQNLIAGEWIFKTFEPKSVAYIFVFFALYYLLRKRHIWVAIHLGLATYFHVLVGGWIVLVIGLFLLWQREWKNGFVLAGTYALSVAPLAVYLFIGYFASEPPQTDINLDWVYCYYRLPNHLGIWRDTAYFLDGHAPDAAFTLLAFIAGWWWHHFLPGPLQLLNRLMLIMFAINLAYVGLAAMDHFIFDNAGGLGLKYYPFRTNSLGLFFAMLSAAYLIVSFLRKKRFSKWVFRLSFAAVFAMCIAQVTNNVQRSTRYFQADPDYRSMCSYISAQTGRGDAFIVLQPGYAHPDYYSFNRRTERENFVVPKFVPAERHKLLQWYERVQLYIKVRADLTLLPKLKAVHGVDYLITTSEIENERLELRHTEGNYRLYKIR